MDTNLDQNSITEFLQQYNHTSDDRRMVAISSAVTCLILIWLIVPLRFVARWCSAMRFGWDDYMIVLALFLSTAFIIDAALSFSFGGGQHVILLFTDYNKMRSYIKNSFANEILFMPTLMAIKVSILLLYGRIFPSKIFHRTLWSVGTFIGLYTLASTIVCLVQCLPLSHLWDFFKPGVCINIVAGLTAFGALNTVTNVVILALPIPMVWKLNTSRTVKIQITAMFLTGAFDTVISIVRTYYISKINILDPTWTETDPVAWTAAEVAVAIICACLPTYRPLFDKSVRKSTRDSKMSQSHYRSDYTTESPVDPEKRTESRIWVQTTIENSWDDHDRASESPTGEDIWNNDLIPASRALSRSHSRGRLGSGANSIWNGLSRSTSIRKLDTNLEEERDTQ